MLAIIGILTIGTPLAFYLCYFLLGRFGFRIGVLLYAIRISAAIGIGVLILFILLLAIEFAQDRFLDHYYHQTRNKKIRVVDDTDVCQYSGNGNLKTSDKQCTICGKDLI